MDDGIAKAVETLRTGSCHLDTCHGNAVGMDEVRVELTDLNSPDTVHPISHTPVEVGSFITIPLKTIKHQ